MRGLRPRIARVCMRLTPGSAALAGGHYGLIPVKRGLPAMCGQAPFSCVPLLLEVVAEVDIVKQDHEVVGHLVAVGIHIGGDGGLGAGSLG